MIIATSGNRTINYNRIISSSTSPYLVLDNRTFLDPSLSETWKLFALYIIDKNYAVSLIYDDPYTELAKIDFLTP